MKKTSKKIVFFGSGPVAAKSLELLLKHQTVEAVITKPTTEHEMKSVAQNIPLFTVTNKVELDKLVSAEKFQSTLGVLIDFGIIVSQKVIDTFEKGIINSHFSLLPEWRGADPITFSLLSGQKKTGISLMLIDTGMDTGNLIMQTVYNIPPDCTAHKLTNDLIELSDNSLRKTIPDWIDGQLLSATQTDVTIASSKLPTYSRKLTKADGKLDFTKPAEILEREVRAFITWPKSYTTIANKDVVILRASVDKTSKGNPGSIFKTADKKIGIQTAEGALIIDELIPAGKSAMSSQAFLAGYGDRL